MTATGDIRSTYSEMTMKICDGYEKRGESCNMMRMNIMTAVIAVVIVAVRAHVVPEDFVVLQEVSVQQGQPVSESPVLREPQE